MMWLYYKLRRLWWKLFGCPIGPITEKEIGIQVVLTDKVILQKKEEETDVIS